MPTIWTFVRAAAVVVGFVRSAADRRYRPRRPRARTAAHANIPQQLISSAANAPQILQNLATALGATPPARRRRPGHQRIAGRSGGQPHRQAAAPTIPGIMLDSRDIVTGSRRPTHRARRSPHHSRGRRSAPGAPAAPAIPAVPAAPQPAPAAPAIRDRPRSRADQPRLAGIRRGCQQRLPRCAAGQVDMPALPPYLPVSVPPQISLPADLPALASGAVPAAPAGHRQRLHPHPLRPVAPTRCSGPALSRFVKRLTHPRRPKDTMARTWNLSKGLAASRRRRRLPRSGSARARQPTRRRRRSPPNSYRAAGA